VEEVLGPSASGRAVGVNPRVEEVHAPDASILEPVG
jgi:hypothetical protein